MGQTAQGNAGRAHGSSCVWPTPLPGDGEVRAPREARIRTDQVVGAIDDAREIIDSALAQGLKNEGSCRDAGLPKLVLVVAHSGGNWCLMM